ncbi:MAG: hypothetical protein U9Q62_08055 [Campylobacterota bacterium]|nr:hypothetical protein [Campylobacterota bacterium]
MRDIKTKRVVLFAILFIVINIAVYGIIEINKRQRVQIALDGHLDKLQTHYEILEYHQKITADATYRSTIDMKKVIDILSIRPSAPHFPI